MRSQTVFNSFTITPGCRSHHWEFSLSLHTREFDVSHMPNPLDQGFPTFFAARTPLSGQSILSTPQKNFEIYIAL